VWVGFLNVKEVYPPSETGGEPAMPAPEDIRGWITQHPYLVTEEAHQRVVGGVTGVQFDHIDPLLAHEARQGCPENIPCEPLFLMHVASEGGHAVSGHEDAAMHEQGMTYALLAGQSAQLMIVNTPSGETATIMIQAYSHEVLEQSSQEVDRLISSVRWADTQQNHEHNHEHNTP
jgi:hypothetical protein